MFALHVREVNRPKPRARRTQRAEPCACPALPTPLASPLLHSFRRRYYMTYIYRLVRACHRLEVSPRTYPYLLVLERLSDAHSQRLLYRLDLIPIL